MKRWLIFTLLYGCTTTNMTVVNVSSVHESIVETKSKPAIKISTRRGFYVIKLDLGCFPKETQFFDLTFNGFYWHRYKTTDEILLVKVKGLPNTVRLTPIDKNGTALEMDTIFGL